MGKKLDVRQKSHRYLWKTGWRGGPVIGHLVKVGKKLNKRRKSK